MAEGYFKAKNPARYKGDANNIIWRSRWELKFMIYLDSSPDVVQWSSEEVIVPYESPVDGKWHRYFVDFWVRLQSGKIYLAEIKPAFQTVPPVKNKRKRYLTEVRTYGINIAKWRAAGEFCKKRGWEFKILTENELNIPVRKKNGKR